MNAPESATFAHQKAYYAHKPQEWQPPIIFPGNDAGLKEAFATGLVLPGGYYDHGESIAGSLFEIYHPDQKTDKEAKEAFVAERMAKGETFGKYVLDANRGQVGRVADADDHFALLTSADRGLVSDEELGLRRQATVLFAGCSVGAKIAKRCAMAGIRNPILADYDKIEWPNGNRLEFDWTDIGLEKTVKLADWMFRRDPYMNIRLLRQGITSESLESIEHLPICTVVDEIDKVSDKVLLARFAAKKDIPVISAADLGHIGQVDIRHPGKRREKAFNGRMTLEEAANAPHGIDSIMRVVGSHNVEPELKEAIEACKRGERPHVPQLDLTAALNGVLATYQVCEIIAGRGAPTGSYAHPMRRTFGWRNRRRK